MISLLADRVFQIARGCVLDGGLIRIDATLLSSVIFTKRARRELSPCKARHLTLINAHLPCNKRGRDIADIRVQAT